MLTCLILPVIVRLGVHTVALPVLICKMNWLVTPNTKKFLEVHGSRRVLMRNRQQKKIKLSSFTENKPTLDSQLSMRKECIRVLLMMKNWQETSVLKT